MLGELDDPDSNHPMRRFELAVSNAMVGAFAEILIRSGYTVAMSRWEPEGPHIDRLELAIIAGPNHARK